MALDPAHVKSIFLAALNLASSEERAAYLNRACGDNAELRRQIEELLAAHVATRELRESNATDPDATSTPGYPDTHGESAPDHLKPLQPATTPYVPDPTEALRPDPAITTDADGKEPSGQPDTSDAKLGTVIAGRYRLDAVIGQGGMGTVYLASQSEPVKRQVALKLIKSGMDTRAMLARFDAERQALAFMDHPNIARIYDGGLTQSGQPFFVMELVRGVPLTRFCDRHRLSVEQRLQLFVSVCLAVQHAHQKGIIHRDLKPGNVLVTEVDGRPTPKVIDFGVAKATEHNLTDLSLTDAGAIVGTPEYMSPEQADPSAADIDTRTDVYALGVMLYELLVGSTPIDSRRLKRGAVLEMLRMVREVDPPRPSTKLSTAEALPSIAANRNVEPAKLTRMLRGELDWVVMKALEKDRARRYETANGFARDIQRYLADEVVEARPPSAAYRLRKFVRRHKGQVIAASLVILALVAGVIGTTVGMLRADQQKKLAQEGWDQAETEKTRAEKNFATAREIIMNMGSQINLMETGQKNPKLADEARKQALNAARTQFDQFRAGRSDDLTVLAQAAALHRYAGNVSRTLSDFPAALDAYTKSIQITEDLTKRFPDEPEHCITLALTLGDLGVLERLMGKLTTSAATLDRAVKLAESLPSMNFDSYFQKTMGKYQFNDSQMADNRRRFENFAYHKTLGWIEVDRGRTAYYRGLLDDSARLEGRASQLLDQLKLGPDKLRQSIDPLLAVIALNYMAVARRELGQTKEALAIHEDTVARMKPLTGPGSSRDEVFWGAEVRRALAQTASILPERRAALANELVDVARTMEKLVEDYPQVAFYREKLADTYLLRGELLTLLGQLEPAAAELAKSLAVSRILIDRFGVLSDSMLVRGRTFLAIGRHRAAAGKNDEAVTNWKNAAKVFELALKIDPENVHHRRGQKEAEQALKPSAK